MRGRALALGLALLGALPGAAEAGRREDDLARVAAGDVTDPALRALLAAHWRWRLDTSPETATALGFPGHDHLVSDRSLAAAEAASVARQDFLAQARALGDLAPGDARWLRLFVDGLEAEVATEACRFERWSVSPRGNAMSDLWSTLDVQPLDDRADGLAYVARLRAFADGMDVHLAALRAGAAEGRVANATSLRKTIDLVTAELDRPLDAWGPSARAPGSGRWGDAFRVARDAALDGPVRAALVRYRDLLRDVLLPVARDDAAPGLATVPDGAACYAATIRAYTTLPRTAAELHATGLAELERIHAAFRALGRDALGTDDLSTIFARLRTDPALRFQTREDVLGAATAALAAAQAATPAWFGTLPATPCVVAEIPAYEAPYTTIAYYRQPRPGGGKPGEYFVNTSAPDTRPSFEARALAFHEGVPGHHTQIALSYELPAAPAFHRFDGSTAFVEGWALYAERLADEMGLYPTALDRLGMLSFDAWRASRLVVDTGLHDLGWSRAVAERFFLENTPLAPNNVVNEVDRYVTWPGQALAYKTGQLEILALRREAEAALGDAFDVRAFHDAVLGRGAVSMPALREQVRAWIAAEGGRSIP